MASADAKNSTGATFSGLQKADGEGFDRLPGDIQPRVTRILQRLENWPEVSGAKPLRGELVGHYRIRTGDYRVQFYVERGAPPEGDKAAEPDTVVVEKIGHRDGFYDD